MSVWLWKTKIYEELSSREKVRCAYNKSIQLFSSAPTDIHRFLKKKIGVKLQMRSIRPEVRIDGSKYVSQTVHNEAFSPNGDKIDRVYHATSKVQENIAVNASYKDHRCELTSACHRAIKSLHLIISLLTCDVTCQSFPTSPN